MTNRNIAWIDYIKAFCMFLVYVNHTEIYYDYKISYAFLLYSPFYVNMFFVLNGYLLYRKYLSEQYLKMSSSQWNTTVKNEYVPNVFFRLVVPTVIFALINYFPKKIIRGESFSLASILMDTIGGGSLWFTSALAIAQLVICLMLCIRRSIRSCVIISCLMFLIAMMLSDADVEIANSASFPWFYKSGLMAVLYMALGGLYWKYEDYISSVLNKHKLLFYFLFLSYIIIVLRFNDVCCDTAAANVNLIGIFVICMSSFLLINIFKIFRESSIVRFIGRNSIGFYFLSGAIPNIISILAKSFISYSNPLVVICLACISFVFAWFVIKLIVRFAPWLFDLRKLKT